MHFYLCICICGFVFVWCCVVLTKGLYLCGWPPPFMGAGELHQPVTETNTNTKQEGNWEQQSNDQMIFAHCLLLENIKQFCVESDVNAHGMLGWLVSAPASSWCSWCWSVGDGHLRSQEQCEWMTLYYLMCVTQIGLFKQVHTAVWLKFFVSSKKRKHSQNWLILLVTFTQEETWAVIASNTNWTPTPSKLVVIATSQ